MKNKLLGVTQRQYNGITYKVYSYSSEAANITLEKKIEQLICRDISQHNSSPRKGEKTG